MKKRHFPAGENPESICSVPDDGLAEVRATHEIRARFLQQLEGEGVVAVIGDCDLEWPLRGWMTSRPRPDLAPCRTKLPLTGALTANAEHSRRKVLGSSLPTLTPETADAACARLCWLEWAAACDSRSSAWRG
jgi:hypothetical protein